MIKAMIRSEIEMKDSGLAWEKFVPIEWTKCRLKDYFEFEKGKNAQIYTKDYIGLHKGSFPVYSGQTENEGVMGEIDTYDYELDECLFSTTVGAKVMTPKVLSGKFSLSQNCLIMRKIRKCVIRFVYYTLFPLFDYERAKIPSYMQPSLSIEDLKTYNLYMPLYTEQKAIADYLDKTCSKIDEIIVEAKASIDEYKELKQSVIFDGISLGIRKCCDYKKTTLKGIKKIPIGWEYRKLKFLIKYIESGVSVNAGNEPAKELEYGVLKTSCVSKMIFLPNENKSVNKDEYDRVKCPVCGNTIIVSRMNTPELVGACAYIEKDINNIFLPDRLWQVHFKDNVNVKYVYYCLISTYIRNYYSSLSTGTSSSMQNISQGQFANAVIPYPSSKEQEEIVGFLDKRTTEIDFLIAEKESLINDLEAYKKSLIYEMVTGKRRVV